MVFSNFAMADTLIFEDDFESYAVGDFPSKWIQMYSGEAIQVVSSPVAGGEKALKIRGASGWAANIYRNTDTPDGDLILEADVYLTSNSAGVNSVSQLCINHAIAKFITQDADTLTVQFKDGTRHGEISANQWHSVVLMLYWSAKKYEVIVDGTSLHTSTFEETTIANRNNLWITASNSASSPRLAYYDNIKLWGDIESDSGDDCQESYSQGYETGYAAGYEQGYQAGLAADCSGNNDDGSGGSCVQVENDLSMALDCVYYKGTGYGLVLEFDLITSSWSIQPGSVSILP